MALQRAGLSFLDQVKIAYRRGRGRAGSFASNGMGEGCNRPKYRNKRRKAVLKAHGQWPRRRERR